jgi:hypothetical protein
MKSSSRFGGEPRDLSRFAGEQSVGSWMQGEIAKESKEQWLARHLEASGTKDAWEKAMGRSVSQLSREIQPLQFPQEKIGGTYFAEGNQARSEKCRELEKQLSTVSDVQEQNAAIAQLFTLRGGELREFLQHNREAISLRDLPYRFSVRGFDTIFQKVEKLCEHWLTHFGFTREQVEAAADAKDSKYGHSLMLQGAIETIWPAGEITFPEFVWKAFWMLQKQPEFDDKAFHERFVAFAQEAKTRADFVRPFIFDEPLVKIDYTNAEKLSIQDKFDRRGKAAELDALPKRSLALALQSRDLAMNAITNSKPDAPLLSLAHTEGGFIPKSGIAALQVGSTHSNAAAAALTTGEDIEPVPEKPDSDATTSEATLVD